MRFHIVHAMLFKKKVEELQSEVETYQKRFIAQKNIIQEIKEESQKRQDKFQVHFCKKKMEKDRSLVQLFFSGADERNEGYTGKIKRRKQSVE